MNKLKLEDLHVESFATSAETTQRGTVVAHATEMGADTCNGGYCDTEQYRGSCSPETCTGTTGGTTSQNGTLCGGTDPGTNCCDPYGPSLAATNCNDTFCCV